MATILINRTHSLPLDQARAKVDDLAKGLAVEHGLEVYWGGNDTLKFKRSGLSGSIQVKERSVAIMAELGFLLSALKGPLEKQIQARLDQELGPI